MTNEELHALFDYEPSGMLRRREGTGGRKAYPWRAIGKEGRYRAATINGSTYYLHRLIYQWHHGSVPEMVDHRDGDPSNNRIENLRTCTNGQNQFNSKRKCSNASGHKGVVYHAKCAGKPWHAKINHSGRRISLGYHRTVEEAAAAYAAGAALIAGEFARKD